MNDNDELKKFIEIYFPDLVDNISENDNICSCLYSFYNTKLENKQTVLGECIATLVFNIGSACCSERNLIPPIDELKKFINYINDTHTVMAKRYIDILKKDGFKIFE